MMGINPRCRETARWIIKFEDDMRKENIKVLSAEATTEPNEMDKVLQAIFEKFKEYEK